MVYPATQAIYDALKAHDLECGIEARDEFSAVHVGINTKNASFEARFISRSEETLRRTAFTKPFSPCSPRAAVRFTASLITARAGIRSRYRSWYTDIRRMFRTAGFIFRTFTELRASRIRSAWIMYSRVPWTSLVKKERSSGVIQAYFARAPFRTA